MVYSEAKIFLNSKLNSYLSRTALTKGSHYFSLYANNNNKPWFHNTPLDRSEIVIINRLRSNHYNLNYSLWRKSYINYKACSCGSSSQDINHVIFCCPLFAPHAYKLVTFLSTLTSDPQLDIFPFLVKPSLQIALTNLSIPLFNLPPYQLTAPALSTVGATVGLESHLSKFTAVLDRSRS